MLNTSIFYCAPAVHRQKNIIAIRFVKDKTLIALLRKTLNCKWSQTMQAWYCADTPSNRKLCQLPEKYYGKEVLAKLSEHNRQQLELLKDQLLLKSYSPATIRTYTQEFAQLLYILRNHKVATLTDEQLKSYFLYCVKKLKLSENHIHSRMNAVKFYFEQVLHRSKIFYDIPRPKKALQLPKALTKQEITKLIRATKSNVKHNLILRLCYGMGLRVSEVVNITLHDIDSENMRVLVARGKGKKDRFVNLPQSVLEDLRIYYRQYKPQKYLFEGMHGRQYSLRSAQDVFKQAMKKACIYKNVGIHSLRHSYATHLLEYGTDISHIQKLLGHNDVKTALKYTHISDSNIAAIKSPLDNL